MSKIGTLAGVKGSKIVANDRTREIETTQGVESCSF